MKRPWGLGFTGSGSGYPLRSPQRETSPFGKLVGSPLLHQSATRSAHTAHSPCATEYECTISAASLNGAADTGECDVVLLRAPLDPKDLSNLGQTVCAGTGCPPELCCQRYECPCPTLICLDFDEPEGCSAPHRWAVRGQSALSSPCPRTAVFQPERRQIRLRPDGSDPFHRLGRNRTQSIAVDS